MDLTNEKFYFAEINAIAIILIILCQIGYNFPNNPTPSGLIIPLSYIGIGNIGFPLMFMVVGAVLINKNYTLSEFIRNHLIKLTIPTIFWIIISMLAYATYTPYSEYFFTNWLINNSYIWFPAALIGSYIVIPVFNSFVKEYGIRSCEYFLLLWIIVLIIRYMGFQDPNMDYIINNIGMYIGYAVLGYYLANKDFKILSGPMIIFTGIILIVSLGVTLHLINTYAVLMDYTSFMIIINGALLFLFFRYIDRYSHFKPSKTISRAHNFIKTSWPKNIVNIISLCSFGMYFISHILIKYTANSYIITGFNDLPPIFISITIISLAMMIILSYIPFLNKLIGIE